MAGIFVAVGGDDEDGLFGAVFFAELTIASALTFVMSLRTIFKGIIKPSYTLP